jgi:predicted DNA-binding transcriptional regulator AlpA
MEIPSELLDRKSAAEYCGLTEDYLLNLAKHGSAGPAFIKTSPRKTLYPRSDLDHWIATWKRTEMRSA